jgi:hypothetical protein
VTVRRTLCAGFAALLLSGEMSFAQTPIDIYAYFQKASGLSSDRLARKTKIVDVRLATPGEVVVTVIKGEGKETQSPPAKAGDVVVRNRCPEAETRSSSSPLRNSPADTTGRPDPRGRTAGARIGRAAPICASSW